MWWFAVTVIALLTWLSWRLLRPSPPIRISRETTHITEPLGPDGLPNYTKHLLTSLRNGITPDNNAAVVMWQSFGLTCNYDTITEDDWQLLDKELTLGPPPASDQVLASIYSPENRQAVIQWLDQNAPGWQRAPIEDPTALAELGMTQQDFDADSIIDQAMGAPWKHDDLPPLADWIERNKSLLDALVEASKRTRFYSPSPSMLRREEGPLVEAWAALQIFRVREFVRALRLRAMLALGEGNHKQAWQDLLAIHRWARLIAQGQFILDQLVAVAIEGKACAAATTLLGSNLFSRDSAHHIYHILRDLRDLPPLSNLNDALDTGERFYMLDALVSGRRKGMGTFIAADLNTGERQPSSFQPLNFIAADWNIPLIEANGWCDRYVAASCLPTHSQRSKVLEELAADYHSQVSNSFRFSRWVLAPLRIDVRSDMLATRTVGMLMPTLEGCLISQNMANTHLALTQIAAALAVYRAQHSEYPDSLDQLVPDVILTLPVDLFHDKPFIYQRDSDGYLLYSCGPNGINDGGSSEIGDIYLGRPIGEFPDPEAARDQIPTGADDFAIRLPRPPFKLPTPPIPDQ